MARTKKIPAPPIPTTVDSYPMYGKSGFATTEWFGPRDLVFMAVGKYLQARKDADDRSRIVWIKEKDNELLLVRTETNMTPRWA